MADAAASASTPSTTSTSFIELKNAYSTATLPQILTKFNIGTILSYFLETRADFKAIRESSFELFTSGHVHHIGVKQDEIAKKAIVSAEVLAHMKQQFYRVILMLNSVGDIIHASCSCPAGSGPNCTCKHTAALCYALEDFVKVFVLPEDIPSCTDKLEAWNKPRLVKLPAAPIYDIDFTRKRHGKKRKQNRPLKGEQAEAYKLNKVCDTERASAESFLCELEQWSKESSPRKQLLINTVASQHDPIETLVSVNPLYDYVEKVKQNITDLSHSDSITKKTELKNCLKVTQDEQLLIQENTLLQSRLSDWFTLRQLRITGSFVSRISNYFLYMTSNPNTISSAILEPSTFSSAAMKYGLDMEPTVINRYVAEKVKEGLNISIKKLGLIIDKDHGFIAASPDGGVEENNSIIGIVECKVAVKWSHKTVGDSTKEPGYPLKSVKINQHGTSVEVFALKPNYAWYHQIQLQLYVCRSFAKYCDLALLHPESGSFHCQRFELNQQWVDKFLPKLETFYDDYMAVKILQKYKKKELV